jgi:hypothetical protein
MRPYDTIILLRDPDNPKQPCQNHKSSVATTSSTIDTIINRQSEDAFLAEEVNRILERRQSTFELREKKSLWFQGRICVPNIPEINEIILKEAHQTPYSIHPGSTNMYMDLKEIFWLSWYFDDSSHRDGLSKGLVGEQQLVRLEIGQ